MAPRGWIDAGPHQGPGPVLVLGSGEALRRGQVEQPVEQAGGVALVAAQRALRQRGDLEEPAVAGRHAARGGGRSVHGAQRLELAQVLALEMRYP